MNSNPVFTSQRHGEGLNAWGVIAGGYMMASSRTCRPNTATVAGIGKAGLAFKA
jgi:hypothetical protein